MLVSSAYNAGVDMTENKTDFTKDYSEESFWSKLKDNAKSVGEIAVRQALQLYYAAQARNTPAWAKSIIYGALAYLIFPVDAIPDTLPVIGFTDDLGVIGAALAAVAAHIDADVIAKADAKLKDWFS